MTTAYDIAIIGAGPAGLSAASAAAGQGARVALLDMAPSPGGQYWMRETPYLRPMPGRQSIAGMAAAQEAAGQGVTIFANAEIWGLFPGFRLCATQNQEALDLTARALIIATGGQDRVMPFPGWTLPGVITPGAAQRLVKLGATPPGQRILLAGSGPFLLAVAQTLRLTDSTPTMLLEAQKPSLRIATHLLRFPTRWPEILGLLRTLRRIPSRRFGWVVTEALGQHHVEAVRIAPISPTGQIDHARAKTIPDIDCLLTGWGFQPSIELTALLGCDHAYNRATGGWHCVADPLTGATSIPLVYAAGETTSIAGALPAQLSGEAAGLSAAAALGFTPDAPRLRAIAPQLRRARHFATGLANIFAPPAALSNLMQGDDLIICRCEEVTKSEITSALAAGSAKLQGAKLWSRACMGHCQGRICGWGVAELAAAHTGCSLAQAGFNPPRLPARPAPLAAIHAALAGPTPPKKT